MSGYPVAAVRRAFVVSYSCLDLTDSSTSSAATTWSSFIAASQRRPCEELKQPPSSKTSSRKTRKSSWRGSRATTGEGTSDRPATTPETAAAERPAIDTTACTRPRRGICGRCDERTQAAICARRLLTASGTEGPRAVCCGDAKQGTLVSHPQHGGTDGTSFIATCDPDRHAGDRRIVMYRAQQWNIWEQHPHWRASGVRDDRSGRRHTSRPSTN